MRRLIIVGLIGCVCFSIACAGQPSLQDPRSLTEVAPDIYKVRLDTSAGPVVIEVHREWAPLGADRFYNLVKYGRELALFPRPQRLHGAGRHERRSCHPESVGARYLS
jgi:hypothetical protein